MTRDELLYRYDVEVAGLLASPQHRYDGRPDAAVRVPPAESATRIEVRAGLGWWGTGTSAAPRTGTPR